MSKALRVPDYLGHILEAIRRIEDYTTGMDQPAFLSSRLVQDAVIRNIEVIGEASNNIQRADPGFTAQHHEIPWSVMYAMRNRVAHGYATIDFDIVWIAVKRDLPVLRDGIQVALARLT